MKRSGPSCGALEGGAETVSVCTAGDGGGGAADDAAHGSVRGSEEAQGPPEGEGQFDLELFEEKLSQVLSDIRGRERPGWC